MTTRENICKQGFTLIEVIAVLVIIAILAAAAVPKFLNLIEDARQKAREGALAAGHSACSLTYGKLCLVNEQAPSAGEVVTGVTADPPAGDFTWGFVASAVPVGVTITVTDQAGDTATATWVLP